MTQRLERRDGNIIKYCIRANVNNVTDDDSSLQKYGQNFALLFEIANYVYSKLPKDTWI